MADMTVIERNIERTDLPLVVIPACFPSMIEFFEQELPQFDGLARVRMYTDMSGDEQLLAQRMSGARVAMTTGVHFSTALLDSLADSTRCITFGGTGVANFVDLEQAKRLGVRICNVVHYGDNAVAEHAIAMMFDLAHHVGEGDRRTRNEGWPSIDIEEVGGQTLGLVGFGGIGRKVASLAHALDMNLLVSARHPDHETLQQLGARSAVDIDQVFAESNIVSMHLALNEQTTGIIGTRQLNLLRPGSLFINTARAELVDGDALLYRLQKGDIRAGLDVFAPEPLSKDDPLRALDNVVLTPHIAWRSKQALQGIVQQSVRAAVAFLQGTAYNVVC